MVCSSGSRRQECGNQQSESRRHCVPPGSQSHRPPFGELVRPLTLGPESSGQDRARERLVRSTRNCEAGFNQGSTRVRGYLHSRISPRPGRGTDYLGGHARRAWNQFRSAIRWERALSSPPEQVHRPQPLRARALAEREAAPLAGSLSGKATRRGGSNGRRRVFRQASPSV